MKICETERDPERPQNRTTITKEHKRSTADIYIQVKRHIKTKRDSVMCDLLLVSSK